MLLLCRSLLLLLFGGRIFSVSDPFGGRFFVSSPFGGRIFVSGPFGGRIFVKVLGLTRIVRPYLDLPPRGWTVRWDTKSSFSTQAHTKEKAGFLHTQTFQLLDPPDLPHEALSAGQSWDVPGLSWHVPGLSWDVPEQSWDVRNRTSKQGSGNIVS